MPFQHLYFDENDADDYEDDDNCTMVFKMLQTCKKCVSALGDGCDSEGFMMTDKK